MIRKAKAVWRGTGRAGNGELTSDSGVLANTPYSFRTRFENEKGTNPEELIAAAHAGCFTMALAFGLQAAGFTPDELSTEAAVSLEPEGQGFRISRSALTLRAKVPNLDAGQVRRIGGRSRKELPGVQGAQGRDHARREAGVNLSPLRGERGNNQTTRLSRIRSLAAMRADVFAASSIRAAARSAGVRTDCSSSIH